MPSINNYIQGFSDGLPGMKDFRHASRLYIDDNFKLAPKNKLARSLIKLIALQYNENNSNKTH